jgi:hypothetical protein
LIEVEDIDHPYTCLPKEFSSWPDPQSKRNQDEIQGKHDYQQQDDVPKQDSF